MSKSIRQRPLPVPLLLRPWIALNPEFGVLICVSAGCYRGIQSPAAASRHLRDKHRVQSSLCKLVDEYIKEFKIAHNYSFRTVPLPLEGSLPQPILQVLNGFQCHDCEYKTQNRRIMRHHANKEHNQKRRKDEEIFKAVRLQSWFGGKRERYWVVNEGSVGGSRVTSQGGVRGASSGSGCGSGSGSGSESGGRDDGIKTAVAEWEEEVKERRLALSQKPPAVELDPWLRYTNWHTVLTQSKHDLPATANFARMPDPEEIELTQVLESWNRILERCLDTLEAVDHKDTLKWWQSPKNEVASQRPFELPQNASTLTRYSRRWQLFLCYILRTTTTESWDEESETGVKYTAAQWNRVQKVREVLSQHSDVVTGVAAATEAEAVAAAYSSQLDTAIMGLIKSIVTQDMSRLPLYESPLMHFLAVCGFDLGTNAFRSSFIYTPILAQVLWILRLLLLEIALPLQPWEEIGISTRVGSIVAQVHNFRERYLCEGSFSPASSILSQLARGKYLNKLHRSPSNIYWSDDHQIVYYLGKGVAVAKIRAMWVETTRELDAILHELLFHQSVPEVPLPQVVDHMGSAQNSRQDGFSFMSHSDNQKTCKQDWQFLYDRMLQDKPEWRLVNGSGSGQREWVDIRKAAYLNQERQFLKLLMVAMHITGGQPARGPELGSIKVTNSIFSPRNIYVLNGRLVFLTTYDKAQKRRSNTEYVLRCLPDEISQILVKYLIYVRPFSEVVGAKELDYLFVDVRGPWAGNQLTAALAVATAKHLGVRLTVVAWRHIAIAIANEHLARASKLWNKDEDDDSDNDEFIEGEDEAEVELNIFEHILVRQSAHGQRVAQRHYAVNGEFLNFLGPELISSYTQASRAWHAFFKVVPKDEVAATAVATQAKHGREASQQLHSPMVKRERSISQAGRGKLEHITISTALKGLRLIYGPSAQPQSKAQAEALELVHRPAKVTDTSIIVLGTGSGKTALFFSLAAVAVNQVVIVVVPYVALIEDLISRARAASSGSGGGSGFTCEEWTQGRSITTLPQLVVVSADRAVQSEFLHFARGLELYGQLLHIFFDECHVAFLDTSYRERLRELWQLRYLNCPFTCLTATLLISLEHTLRQRLLLENALLFRRGTMRRTIRYSIIEVERGAPFEHAIQVLPSLPLPPGKRGVIYVRTYSIGDKLKEALGFPFYKSRSGEKSEMLSQWGSGSGNGGWIIATGALGTGINIAGVLYVVHVDRPYGLTSFMQQSGRGGRGGEVSDSIIFIRSSGAGSGSGSSPASAYSVEHQDEAALEQFLSSQTCRREVLAREFDGDTIGTSCTETDSILCDRCHESIQARDQSEARDMLEEDSGSGSGSGSGKGSPVSGSTAIALALQQKVQRDEELGQAMDQLQRHCIYCQMIHGDQGDSKVHVHRHCHEAEEAHSSHKKFRLFRARLKLARAGQCYRCGLGQEFCSAIEEGRQCEYPHLMLVGIWILHMHTTLQEICEDLGFLGEYIGPSGPGSGYKGLQWQWLNGFEEEGSGFPRELRWMRVWRVVCRRYLEMVQDLG